MFGVILKNGIGAILQQLANLLKLIFRADNFQCDKRCPRLFPEYLKIFNAVYIFYVIFYNHIENSLVNIELSRLYLNTKGFVYIFCILIAILKLFSVLLSNLGVIFNQCCPSPLYFLSQVLVLLIYDAFF
jgi:hypothetical protein